DFYPSPVHGTVRRSCGNRRGEDTSCQRFCPQAFFDSANALRSRLPSLRGGPSPGAPVPGPWQCAAPGGDHVPGAPALCGGDAVELSPVFLCIVAWETWGAPSCRWGLMCWLAAQHRRDMSTHDGACGGPSSSHTPVLLAFFGPLCVVHMRPSLSPI